MPVDSSVSDAHASSLRSLPRAEHYASCRLSPVPVTLPIINAASSTALPAFRAGLGQPYTSIFSSSRLPRGFKRSVTVISKLCSHVVGSCREIYVCFMISSALPVNQPALVRKAMYTTQWSDSAPCMLRYVVLRRRYRGFTDVWLCLTGRYGGATEHTYHATDAIVH
jgi:hypothetical protein